MRERYLKNKKKTAEYYPLRKYTVPAETDKFMRNEAGGESHEK